MFISEKLIQKIIHELDECEVKVFFNRLLINDTTQDSYKGLFEDVSDERLFQAICGLKEKAMWEKEDLEQLQELPKHLTKTLPEPVYEWFCSLSANEEEEMFGSLLEQKEDFLRLIEWECGHTLINLEIYIILYLQNELRMSSGIILQLFKWYAKEEDYDGLMRQAEEWDGLNIRTLETLKWYTKIGWAYPVAIQAAFEDEKLSQEEKNKAAYTWGRREKYDLGLVIYACLITKKMAGFAAFHYADAVLSNMKIKNIRSLDELEDPKKCGKMNIPVVQRARRMQEAIYEKKENWNDEEEGISNDQDE